MAIPSGPIVPSGDPAKSSLTPLAAETAGPHSQREPSSGTERILDADEISAELVADAPASPGRSTRSARPFGTPPPARPRQQPSAALAARLETAEAELQRLRRQMRARDAYLVELEHALAASTSKLEASGIGSIEDAHKLLGRVRGQAFRIAELESELRHMEQRLSRLAGLLPAGYTA